jgi:hypothetical protein
MESTSPRHGSRSLMNTSGQKAAGFDVIHNGVARRGNSTAPRLLKNAGIRGSNSISNLGTGIGWYASILNLAAGAELSIQMADK